MEQIGKDKDVYQQFARLYDEIHKRIVGNEEAIECILISLLCDGHVLLESVPGMGKTMLAKTISETLNCEFKRIQGTPDLTATDITGKLVYDEKEGKYVLRKGPVFTNILLMDEINRAPPMTQSALLEVMEEKKVTMGGVTYELPKPFIVIATENPLEQKGVFPLPEAQKDRFLFKVIMMYLTTEEEASIVKSKLRDVKINRIFNPAEILILRKEIKESVTIDDSIIDYAIKIVNETRNRRELQTGASPRASIAFMETAKAKVFLEGRDNVTVADIKKLAYPILRHRIILNPEYVEMRVTPDDIIKKILDKIEAPM
ncbi:MAG: magnesium chelatase [Candidatus Altiarchaeales archaeon]|nr:MAG: magnesium chelatase [Candidatus Altiarchaeales archaeon]